jgi:cupin 2 domain-containing protein
MDACREAITREMARIEVSGSLYQSAATVLAAIDGFALMLTGKRDYFHLKGHGGQWDHGAISQRRKEPVMIGSGDLFANVSTRLNDEEIAVLAELPGVKIERIVSTGQASPPGFWYDQGYTEWVVLFAGSAGLLIEGEDAPRILRAGSYVMIPPHARHRVEWTDADEPTIWLAVHSGRFSG